MSEITLGARILPAPPVEDIDSAPFWEAARAHRLIIQVCTACGRPRFPAMPACPYCATPGVTWVPAPRDASIYSWVRVHRTANPPFAESVPYVVATVELAPGCRMVARLEGTDEFAIGTPVAPVFVDHEAWTEVRFRVRDDGDADG